SRPPLPRRGREALYDRRRRGAFADEPDPARRAQSSGDQHAWPFAVGSGRRALWTHSARHGSRHPDPLMATAGDMTRAQMEAGQAFEPVTPGDYIQAMGQHVASVCVITTALDGERYGLTATAVSSVSAQPPRLLVCVNRASFTHAKIAEAGVFCVNVLSETQ